MGDNVKTTSPNRSNKAGPGKNKKDEPRKVLIGDTKTSDPETPRTLGDQLKQVDDSSSTKEKEKVLSSSSSDDDYEVKKQEKVVEEKITVKDRLRKYWITQQMVERSPDIELRIRTALSEFCTFFLFFLTTLIVVYGKRSISEFHLTDSLRLNFVYTQFKTPQYRSFNFPEIKSAPDVWAFLQQGFVETMYSDYYYLYKGTSDPGNDIKVLYESVLVGLPRIRMKANTADSCIIHHIFRRQFISCFDYYSEAQENRSDFGIDRLWEWNNCANDYESSYWGIFGTYNPGGYVETLSYNSRSDTIRTLTELKKNFWVARRTRVIFLDFLVYNTQVNLFSRAQFVLEFPPSGGVYPTHSFKTVRLFSYMTTWDFIVGGFELTFGLFVLYYIVEEFREIRFFKLKFLKYFRNYLDLTIVMCSLYISIFTLVKAKNFAKLISRIVNEKTLRKSYISLDHYIYYEWYYYKITGLLIFICHLKMFNFLHFSSYMSTLNIVIIRSLNHILGFLIMFGLVYFAFAELGYLLFGTSAHQFRSYWASMFTLFKILLGNFDYLELEATDRVMGPLFFLAYLFSVFFFLVNMFLAIVNETYVQARHEKDRFGIQHALPIGRFLERGFWNAFTFLGRPSHEAREQQRAHKTLLRVKTALLKSNFTLTEISMFLAKYGIDGKRTTHPHDIHIILKDLERKGHKPMEPPTIDELKMKTTKGLMIGEDDILSEMEGKWTGLTLKNFKDVMARLLYIEKQIASTSRRLSNIGDVIENASGR